MSDKQVVTTQLAPAAIGPYSQAIMVGDHVFTAGQLGMEPVSGNLAEGILAQTTQALTNLQAVLAAAGCSLQDVVKTTVFLADMDEFATMNGVYEAFFAEPYPARSAVQAARLPKDGRVEIEAIAVRHRP